LFRLGAYVRKLADWRLVGFVHCSFFYSRDNTDNALFNLTWEDPKAWFSIKQCMDLRSAASEKSADEAGKLDFV